MHREKEPVGESCDRLLINRFHIKLNEYAHTHTRFIFSFSFSFCHFQLIYDYSVFFLKMSVKIYEP